MQSPAATATLGVIPRHAFATMTGLEQLQAILAGTLPAPPFSRTTDIWLTAIEPGRAVFAGRPSENFLNPGNTIHAGWTSAILDSALSCAVHSTLGIGEFYTTVEFKIHLVRALTPQTGEVRCEAGVVHRGGRIATSEAKLFDGQGKLLAHGTETCLILRVGKDG